MHAYILAGGFSRRFGRDKTLFEIDGEPLILRIYRKVSRFFPTFVVAKDLEKYRRLGIENLIPDGFKDLQTPLVGIVSGLKHSPFEFNLFLSADLPLLCEEYLSFVKNYNYTRGYYGFIPTLGGRYHFTCGVYSKAFVYDAEKGLLSGEFSLKRFLKNFLLWEEGFLKKNGVGENCCFNLNTPRDLEVLKKL
jgi:molybdopterin-guanine dinucleotide biosynthesis protein A